MDRQTTLAVLLWKYAAVSSPDFAHLDPRRVLEVFLEAYGVLCLVDVVDLLVQQLRALVVDGHPVPE